MKVDRYYINHVRLHYWQVLTCLLGLLLCCTIGACTKEGQPGPQGPQGPPGEGGTGGGGTGLYVLSYEIAGNYSWEQMAIDADENKTYRLKYTTPSRVGNFFSLPDSVTKYIETGALAVFGGFVNNAGDIDWQQISFMPAEFYDRASYYYVATKTTAGYQFVFHAHNVPHVNEQVYSKVRFMIIPKTISGALR